MVYLLALCVGLVSMLAGWFAAGVAVILAGPLMGLASPALDLAPSPAVSILSTLGGAAGLLGGIAITLWRYGGFHSLRDIAGRGVAVMVMLVALLAGAAAIRLAMMEHFGITSTAVEFEIRMPRALAQAARSEVQVELRTDLNQTVALLRDQWQAFDDGRVVVSGRVPIRFKTTQRMMALNLPGQPTRLFKLRLAANPSPSDTFGPWIQVDAVDADTPFAERMKMTDGFAIRYRAL